MVAARSRDGLENRTGLASVVSLTEKQNGRILRWKPTMVGRVVDMTH